MEAISYITNQTGEKLALVIDLKRKSDITPEYLEDLQDIIAFELLKDEESLDYDREIENILNKNV